MRSTRTGESRHPTRWRVPIGIRSIGYYIHHHGRGHLSRYRAIASVSGRPLVALSERTDVGSGVTLPGDVPARDPVDTTAGGTLHWAPLDIDTAAPRLHALADWFDAMRPAGVVVDVSVEVALACRLAGVPVVMMRQHGDRSDPAHTMAYAAATRLIAPFPVELDTSASCTVRSKTDHVGFVRPPQQERARRGTTPGRDDVVVVWGEGGGSLSGSCVDAIASRIRGVVYCAGRGIWPTDDPPRAPNVTSLGWVPDVGALLGRRPVLITSAGNNCVALAASHRCPLVVVPLPRPFDEQVHHAAALSSAGVAAIAPGSSNSTDWGDAIELARRRRPNWGDVDCSGRGAQNAAASIDRWLP